MTTINAAALRTAPQPRWVYDSTDDFAQVISQPKDGIAVVACGGDQTGLTDLRGIDAATGKVKWSADNAFYTNLPPTVGQDGNLYAESNDGNSIVVLDPKSGKVLKNLPEDVAMYSRPSAGKSVYVGAADTQQQGVYALDPATGKEKWHRSLHYLTGITPTEVAGSVLCENGSDIYALDPDSGNLKWSFRAEAGVSQAPVQGPDGLLYLVDGKDTVYAIDPKAAPDAQQNMAAKWTNHLDKAIPNPDGINNPDASQPLIFGQDGIIAVASNVSARQIDIATGQQKWETPAPIDGVAAASSGGQVFAGDANGVLAINHDGTTSWWDAHSGASNAGAPATAVAQYAVGKFAGFQ